MLEAPNETTSSAMSEITTALSQLGLPAPNHLILQHYSKESYHLIPSPDNLTVSTCRRTHTPHTPTHTHPYLPRPTPSYYHHHPPTSIHSTDTYQPLPTPLTKLPSQTLLQAAIDHFMYLLEDNSVATVKLAGAKQALYRPHFMLKAEWIEAAFVVAAEAKGSEGYGAADAIGFIEKHACAGETLSGLAEGLEQRDANGADYNGEAAMDRATAEVAAQEEERVRNGVQPRTPWTMDTLRIKVRRLLLSSE